MKNKIFPLVLFFPAVAGLCAAILRGAQFRDAENLDGFISGSTPYAYGLVILCALVFAIAIGSAVLFTKWIKLRKSDMPGIGVALPFCVASIIILVYAGFIFLSLKAEFNAINLILGFFSLYCSVALFILGKYRMAERDTSAYCIISSVPVFWACFMLILTFREKISDPVIWDYVFHIFSYLSILFSAYSIAAHALGKSKKGVAVFSCFCGIFFFLIEIVSPFVSGNAAELTTEKITELLPQLAFLILVPFTTIETFRKD